MEAGKIFAKQEDNVKKSKRKTEANKHREEVELAHARKKLAERKHQ
ncbi:MAG: hypothetical protein JSV88_19840 [Candidatus Aminicenantes bacterium]|nr:MAG: hypothetical protein JSV88_19840 [Candidatus Aminicenantes bacterium]